MSKEKQIEEMFNDVVEAEQRYHEYCLANICHACEYYGDGECDNHIRAEYLYNAGYRKQSEGEWIERPDLRGFVCSNGCGELLTELERDASLPKFCPNCGTKMKNGTTIQEHVEILCKRFCRIKYGAE